MKLYEALLHRSSMGLIEEGEELEAFHLLADEVLGKHTFLNKQEFIQASFWDDIETDSYVGENSRFQFYDFTLDEMNDDGLVIRDHDILAFYSLGHRKNDVRGRRVKGKWVPRKSDPCLGFHIEFIPLKVGIGKRRIPEDYTGMKIYKAYHDRHCYEYVEEHEFMATHDDFRRRFAPVKTRLNRAEFLTTSFWYDLIERPREHRYDNFNLEDMAENGMVIYPYSITSFYPAHYQTKTTDAAEFRVDFIPMSFVKRRHTRDWQKTRYGEES